MSDNNIVSMNINESLIKPIVEAQMKQAILDKVSGEHAQIKEMHDWKSCIIYYVYRYMPWWLLVKLP